MQLLPVNTYLADPALRGLLRAWLRPPTLEWAEPRLTELGELAATELPKLGEECERNPAWLRPIEPWGQRVDEVVYPESWRRLADRAALAPRFHAGGVRLEPGTGGVGGVIKLFGGFGVH